MSNRTSEAKPTANIWKRASRVLLLFFTGYVLLALLAVLFQRRLIYFPTKLTQEQAGSVAAPEGFQPWRNAAGQIIGWQLPASSSATAVVLIVHGNAGCAVDRAYLAKPIHEAGDGRLDVRILEYPGYGSREGSPGLNSVLGAAEEALALLDPRAPVFVVSESLGAGVAAHLAKVHGDRVSGLILFAPYNSLASVGQRQMPFLPVSLLLRDRFNPAGWLKDYRGPASFVIAGADEIIPTALGHKLHDGYSGPKRLQVIAGARHNDIAVQSPEWWRETLSFLLQNPPANARQE